MPGSVVVQRSDQVLAPSLARVVATPLTQGDAVAVGEVVAILQPTTPEIEALDAAARALSDAELAASGPAAERPSASEIEALIAARDAAADAVRNSAAAPTDAIEVTATASGVIVAVDVADGALVTTGDALVSIGQRSDVEVHARVASSVLPLFLDSFDDGSDGVVVDRTGTTDPQAVELAPSAERTVSFADDESVLRLRFVDAPAVTEGQRVDVEVSVAPAADTRSLPLAAVRTFAGETFVLVDDGEGGARRVDVTVTRLGTERVEVDGALDLGDRVLLP